MQKDHVRVASATCVCVMALALTGCGSGGSSSAGDGGPPPPPPVTTYTVGGAVSGLPSGGSVTLVNNGTDPVTVDANGSFAFSTGLAANASYDVTVQSESPGVRCALGYAIGTVGSANVTSVAVTCVSATDRVVYSFNLAGTTDGDEPRAGLIMDSAGNLYGTTYFGGAHDVEFQGDGTIFEIGADGTETVLYSFAGGTADGQNPVGGLLMDGSGNFYGATASGGTNRDGTVFKLSADGTESVLYSFAGGTADGANPQASLVMDSAGNLYGTTSNGGTNNDGTVFRISASGTETVLHSFGSATDGINPAAALVMDGAGNLYGTTQKGGVNGNGMVFEISAGGAESVLYSFGTGPDGRYPTAALIRDSAGNFYGTTSDGGAFGFGTVFRLSATGSESVLYSFSGDNEDGGNPDAPLIMDSAGNLYGTTEQSGAYNGGTVFELAKDGTETTLHAFATSPVDGEDPTGDLVMDSAGDLYGTTAQGGTDGSGSGVVFEVSAAVIAAGGSSSGGNPTYVVGGTVSGLLPGPGQGVTLMNDGTDLVTVGINGGFAFPTRLAPGSAYDVTLVSATSSIPCTVKNGTGTVGTSNVTTIAVTCIAPTFTVGGTVSGLAAGESVTLLDNGGDALTVSANGAYRFATAVAEGSDYDVTVQSQTSGITCTVGNWTGTIGSSNVTNVVVSCAPTEIVLYSFSGTDGKFPVSNLVRDSAGNLYGTTEIGGAHGNGTVFEISAGGTESTLYSFVGGSADGANPEAALILDSAGNLYGTTPNGGAYGYGTVFKLDTSGTESILHSFSNAGGDGESPVAALIMDSAGNLYGTTQNGGAHGDGTVFEISAGGTESVLYSFAGLTADGANPEAALIMDSAGNLYGTTSSAGADGDGTVFKLSAGGTESVLYSFTGGADGGGPTAALIMDSSGNLYGTTPGSATFGNGTVFELSAGGTETVLHAFGNNGTDGAYPDGALIMDSTGNLYGTTSIAGAGTGIVYKLAPDGTETILHNFGFGGDGANPVAGLIMDSAGNVYGTTQNGGANGDGTVFEVSN